MALRTSRPVPRKRHARFGGGAGGSSFKATAQYNWRGLDAIEKGIAGPELGEVIDGVLKRVYDRSQEIVVVLTGELKGSGYYQTEVVGAVASGEVGYTADHAAPVEYGAQGREPKPFLRPAWDEVVTFGDAKEEMADKVRDLFTRLGGL